MHSCMRKNKPYAKKTKGKRFRKDELEFKKFSKLHLDFFYNFFFIPFFFQEHEKKVNGG